MNGEIRIHSNNTNEIGQVLVAIANAYDEVYVNAVGCYIEIQYAQNERRTDE